MKEDDKIEELKQLLLDTDLEKLNQIDIRLKEVANDLYVRERLEQKVNPIIDDRFEVFQREIPETMGPAITAALRKQIKDSQQEIVDLLYPLIGKMIAKYIRIEIQRISEKIDRQFKKTFSFEVWGRRIKAFFSGTNQGDLAIREIAAPEIQEIFMVTKGSGILLGKYSRDENMDSEMIAGMLTAIKSFAEDAFKKGGNQLEMIEYESFKIKIFNLGSFYIAVTIAGVMNAEFDAILQEKINDLVDSKLRIEKIDIQGGTDFSNDLKLLVDGTKF